MASRGARVSSTKGSAAEAASAAVTPAAAAAAAAGAAAPAKQGAAPKKNAQAVVPPAPGQVPPAPRQPPTPNEAAQVDLATVLDYLKGFKETIDNLAERIATVEEKVENAQPPAGVVERGPADLIDLLDPDKVQELIDALRRNEAFWKALTQGFGALAVLLGRGVAVPAAQCVQVLIDTLKLGFIPKDLKPVVCKGHEFDESALRSVADQLFGLLGKGDKSKLSLPPTFQRNTFGGVGIAGELRRNFYKNHLEGVAKKDSDSSLQFVNRKRNADGDADSLRKIDEEMQHLRRHEDATTFSEAGRTDAANIFRACFSNAANLRELERRFVQMISTAGYVAQFVEAQAESSARKKSKKDAAPVDVAAVAE